MGEFGIGQPVRRFEDKRLLSGNGRFQNDNNLLGQAYAYVLRSPHAHARIRALDLAAANAAPGVAMIMTGDVLAKGAGEAGTVGALPAIVNAVVDALSPLGVKSLDMPATSARVWRAIRDARA